MGVNDREKWPVSSRLNRSFQHTCNIYKPKALASDTGTGWASDPSTGLSPTPAYTNVVCRYESTENFNEPIIEGETKQTNIFTADKWHFYANQDMASNYVIVMTTAGHPLNGVCWIVQGNAQINASTPGRPANSLTVNAIVGPPDTLG
jgi:hypothetical protein